MKKGEEEVLKIGKESGIVLMQCSEQCGEIELRERDENKKNYKDQTDRHREREGEREIQR